MSRQRPWRAEHPDAVIVSRPGRWGNPISLALVAEFVPRLAPGDRRAWAVDEFRCLAKAGGTTWRWKQGRRYRTEAFTYPTVAEIRAELSGRDLACWCPLDQPCHADVLLELANAVPE